VYGGGSGREFVGQAGMALGALCPLGIQTCVNGGEFFVHERFQVFQVVARAFAQVRRFFLQRFLEPRGTLLIVAHVCAKQNVANLVDIARPVILGWMRGVLGAAHIFVVWIQRSFDGEVWIFLCAAIHGDRVHFRILPYGSDKYLISITSLP